MNPFGYLVIALGILVVILISLTLSRIKDRKIIAGSLHGMLTMIVLLILVVSLLAFSNLNTYNRLVFEKDIAEISIKQVAEQKFLLEFINTHQSVIVNGRMIFSCRVTSGALMCEFLNGKDGPTSLSWTATINSNA